MVEKLIEIVKDNWFKKRSIAVALIIISIVLTLIAGLIPSRVASKKDPVEALRSE